MNRKGIIKNFTSSLILWVFSLIFSFIVPPLIIDHYGSEVNGLLNSLTQFLAYIVLLEGGVGPVVKNALFRPIIEKNKEKISDILGSAHHFFSRISYIFILYIILLCIFYPLLINKEFNAFFTISLILIISISFFLEYFMGITYRLFLKSDQKDYVVDYIDIFGYIANTIATVTLINLNAPIQIVKLLSSLILIVRPIALKIYFEKKYPYTINKRTKYKLPKRYDGLTHHIAATVQSNTDVIILTIFSSLSNVSVYSVYALVTSGVRKAIVAFTNGIDAFFGKIIAAEDHKQLRGKFELYSFCFYTIATILLGCALTLIIPFMTVYMNGATDANYIQPVFAYILIFAEFCFIIRYPYSSIVFAKGDFKETAIASIIEPIINILLSVTLVIRLGLVGVAIGTLASMLIRSFGFIFYASKHILKTKLLHALKIIFISALELIAIFIVYLQIGENTAASYIDWLIMAARNFILISLFVIICNLTLCHQVSAKILKYRRKT